MHSKYWVHPTEHAKLMFGYSARIYNSDIISRATDIGTPTRVHGVGTHGLYSEEAHEVQGPGGVQRLICIRKF
jgi:hypothetical protein